MKTSGSYYVTEKIEHPEVGVLRVKIFLFLGIRWMLKIYWNIGFK
jgi:hypothetical protein